MDRADEFQERRFPRRIAGFAFKASFSVVDFGFGFDRSTGARQADGQSRFADKIAQSGRSTKMREDPTLLGGLEKDVSGKQFDHATPSFEEDDEMSFALGAAPESGKSAVWRRGGSTKTFRPSPGGIAALVRRFMTRHVSASPPTSLQSSYPRKKVSLRDLAFRRKSQ